jgi:hypothetical protein
MAIAMRTGATTAGSTVMIEERLGIVPSLMLLFRRVIQALEP